MKKTGFLPPAATLVQRKRPKLPLSSPSGSQRAVRRDALRLMLADELRAAQEEIDARERLVRSSNPIRRRAVISTTIKVQPENGSVATNTIPPLRGVLLRPVAVGIDLAFPDEYVRDATRTASRA
jgi:hypothetical protein